MYYPAQPFFPWLTKMGKLISMNWYLQVKSNQPVWVSAANLQQSLAGSPAVPLMHAAADRQRRLAVAAALARQHLLLGVQPGQQPMPHATAAAAQGGATAAAALPPSAGEGSQQVLGLMEQIVQQNQQLQEAVLGQRDQLNRQEVRSSWK